MLVSAASEGWNLHFKKFVHLELLSIIDNLVALTVGAEFIFRATRACGAPLIRYCDREHPDLQFSLDTLTDTAEAACVQAGK
jgi:hypothetical protein